MTVNEPRILYTNEKTERDVHYLHIYGVRLVDGYINVCAYSDSSKLDLYLNGRLCNRQKSDGCFDFYEPLNITGSAEIKVSSVCDPDLFQSVNVTI